MAKETKAYGQTRLPLFDTDRQPRSVGDKPGDLSPHSVISPIDPLSHLTTEEREAPLCEPFADQSRELVGYEKVTVEQSVGNQQFVHHFPEVGDEEYSELLPDIQLQELRKQNGLPPVLHPDDFRVHPDWEAIDMALQRHLNLVDTFQPQAHTEINETVDPLVAKQDAYIQAYVSSGGMTKTALRKTGTTYDELKNWRLDSEFVERYNEAMEHWHEELRKAAFIRAQQKSDVLLIFMLKALKPDVYDDDIRKANWMAKQGLLGDQNLPVRATLVRDNTFNIMLGGTTTAPDGATISGSRSTLLSDLPEGAPKVPANELRKNDRFSPERELQSGEWVEMDEALNPRPTDSDDM